MDDRCVECGKRVGQKHEAYCMRNARGSISSMVGKWDTIKGSRAKAVRDVLLTFALVSASTGFFYLLARVLDSKP